MLAVQRPEPGFAAVGCRRAGEREFAASVVDRTEVLKIEIGHLSCRQFSTAYFDQQLGDQRALHHQAGQFFNFGHIVPVVVDAVAIEADRREAEQQRRVGLNRLVPFRFAGNRRRCREPSLQTVNSLQ